MDICRQCSTMRIKPAFITNSSSTSLMGWGLVFKKDLDQDIRKLVDQEFGDDAFWNKCMEDREAFPTIEVSTCGESGHTTIYIIKSTEHMEWEDTEDGGYGALIFNDYNNNVDPAWVSDLQAFCQKWKIPFDPKRLSWFYMRYMG